MSQKRPVLIIGGGGGGGSASWGGITGTLSDQTDLQTALDAKAPLASPALTGIPTAPTAAANTSTTQLATTAFAKAEADAAEAASQPLDSDLTAIAGLVPVDDDIIQRKAGAWTNRTIAQYKADLGSMTPSAHATSHQSGGSDPVKLDDLAAPDDNTDLNASTTVHGLLVKATAPTAGLRNVVGIDNAETAYTNKALFDATNPAAVGSASVGSAMTAARRDHAHPLTLTGPVTTSTGVATTLACVIQLACSDTTTAITAGTAKLTFRMPFAMTLTAVRASVSTAPTGSTIIIDINETGTTVLSTKLSIDATEKTSTTAASAAVISDSALADDAEITIDFDQVGSTVAGVGVVVTLIGTRT